MLCLGALLTLPTLSSGGYAFREVLGHGALDPDQRWMDVAAQSGWSAPMWDYMRRHLLLNSSASALFVLCVVVWLGASNALRRELYWLLMVLVLLGAGLVVAGAWNGGEAVYRFGVGVSAPSHGTLSKARKLAALAQESTSTQTMDQGTTSSDASSSPSQSAQYSGAHEAAGHTHETGESPAEREQQRGLSPVNALLHYLAPPLQLHTVLAGFVAAVALAALGLTGRRSRETLSDDEQQIARSMMGDPWGVDIPSKTISTLQLVESPLHAPAEVSPARYWLLVGLLVFLTALGGAWAVLGSFRIEAMRTNLEVLKSPEHARLLLHVFFGVGVLVIALLLALLAWLAPRQRLVSLLVALVLVGGLAVQAWLGVLMLYDSQEGPLTSFSSRETPGELSGVEVGEEFFAEADAD